MRAIVILLCALSWGCSIAVVERPAPPSERNDASIACLTPAQAYDLSLERQNAALPRYRPASTRNGIEVFGRAIAVIANARHWSHRAADTCVSAFEIAKQ